MSARPNVEQWHMERKHPRVPLSSSLEIHARYQRGAPVLAIIENVSMGGILAYCRDALEHSTDVSMLFSLPNGHAIRAFGKVTYRVPGGKCGIQFTGMDDESRQELQEFTRHMLGHNRRSGRIPYRVHVKLRPSEATAGEEPAMTVLASRNGGLLVCRNGYTPGQEFYLSWPDRELGAKARVVFQQVWQADQLVEMGFEFLEEKDFWELDFPEEINRA